MTKALWYSVLGVALFISVGCQDEVTTIKQKEETHTSTPKTVVVGSEDKPKMSPIPDEPPLVSGRWPGSPPGVSPQAALMARRAAELDAYRKLGERIIGLRIDSRTTVADFVTQQDVIRAETSGVLRGVTFTRYDFPPGGGICEAEAAVRLSWVITYLRELHTRDFKGDNVKALDYETMRQVNKETVLTATGQGAIQQR